MSNQQAIEYNGWKGNGDSHASARLTWLTVLWLSADVNYEEHTRQIVSTYNDVEMAAAALQAWVTEVVLGTLIDRETLAGDILRSTVTHEVNWREIVLAVRDRQGNEGEELPTV